MMYTYGLYILYVLLSMHQIFTRYISDFRSLDSRHDFALEHDTMFTYLTFCRRRRRRRRVCCCCCCCHYCRQAILMTSPHLGQQLNALYTATIKPKQVGDNPKIWKNMGTEKMTPLLPSYRA